MITMFKNQNPLFSYVHPFIVFVPICRKIGPYKANNKKVQLKLSTAY